MGPLFLFFRFFGNDVCYVACFPVPDSSSGIYKEINCGQDKRLHGTVVRFKESHHSGQHKNRTKSNSENSYIFGLKNTIQGGKHGNGGKNIQKLLKRKRPYNFIFHIYIFGNFILK